MASGDDIRVVAGQVPNPIQDELNGVIDALYFRATTPAGLGADSTNSADIGVSALSYLHDGEFQNLSATTAAFTADDHDIGASASTTQAVYVVSADGSGSLTVTKGNEKTTDSINAGAPVPAGPAREAQLGDIRIEVDSGNTFDATSDNLDTASHLSTSFTDYGAFGAGRGPGRINP